MLRRVAIVMFLATTGAACSADNLSPALVEPTSEKVADRMAEAGIDLSADEIGCVARLLTDEQAGDLTDADLAAGVADALAESTISCAGSETIAASALRPLAAEASVPSLECAADLLDDDLTASLLSASFGGVEPPASSIELDVATALALCLEPQELLDRG